MTLPHTLAPQAILVPLHQNYLYTTLRYSTHPAKVKPMTATSKNEQPFSYYGPRYLNAFKKGKSGLNHLVRSSFPLVCGE